MPLFHVRDPQNEARLTKAQRKQQPVLIANGDLRLSANQMCWPAQHEMECRLVDAVEAEGFKLVRAHPYKADEDHGFIGSQKEGMDVFADIDPQTPLIVAESCWQYTHHILHGLMTHRGPILTVANWSGQWPGLVGMLNINGSLTKAGTDYSTLWSEDFTDRYFRSRLRKWLNTGNCTHATSHTKKFRSANVPAAVKKTGQKLADELRDNKAILGVFDEGCMGMFNAIVPDHLLNQTGVFKERLSQSTLVYEMSQVSDAQAKRVRQWYDDKGMTFHTGPKHDEDLTEAQILDQCKMYIAALRIADDFGCSVIGIQYQQGLKDLAPASDLAEGTINNVDRPPVFSRDGKRELFKGTTIPNFNEVDECAGLDALMTHRVQGSLNQPIETTLHDLRWGDADQSGTVDDHVWVFMISGAVPPAHHIGGWNGSDGHRQPPMFFPNGGSTLRGVSKPGEIVWSRIWIDGTANGASSSSGGRRRGGKRSGQAAGGGGELCMDLGRGGVVELPKAETQRRWEATTPPWPIMHGVTYGTSRDQMMAQHKANHLQVVYADDAKSADKAMLAKASMADALGMRVTLCGTQKNGKSW